MLRLFFVLLIPLNHCVLTEIGHFYIPDTDIDGVQSIALDIEHKLIFTANTPSATIDVLSYKIDVELSTGASLNIIKSIDISTALKDQISEISSIAYSPKKYIIATIIPLQFGSDIGYLLFIKCETFEIFNVVPIFDCYSPNFLTTTDDGNRIIISCKGTEDKMNGQNPPGSISIIDLFDNHEMQLSNLKFDEYDVGGSKSLNNDIINPNPNTPFTINAQPQHITIDTNSHFAYITLQSNNGIAVIDLYKMDIIDIYSIGVRDYGLPGSGLDCSDVDHQINIESITNLYGLRQSNGIYYYKNSKNNKEYLLTANQGSSEPFTTKRMNEINLNKNIFENINKYKNNKEGRLKIAEHFGDSNSNGIYDSLFTFGSRDFTIFEIQTKTDLNCDFISDLTQIQTQTQTQTQKARRRRRNQEEYYTVYYDELTFCEYPYDISLIYESFNDFEDITAAELGTNGFNANFASPSFDDRSDDQGPEPKTIIVGECNNGVRYAFIGLNRVGGLMVYNITDMNNIYFIQYINTRNFDIYYNDDIRPPEEAGDVQPDTLIFTDDGNGNGLLFVGYRYSSSIGIYHVQCNDNTHSDNHDDVQPNIINNNQFPLYPLDSCEEQAPCLHVDVTQQINSLEYNICMYWDRLNVECLKQNQYDHIDIATNGDDDYEPWFDGIDYRICQQVECDTTAIFNINDGDCKTEAGDLNNMLIDDINVECYPNNDDNSCEWAVITPHCIHEEQQRVSTCELQEHCLQIDILESKDNDNDEYDICLYWDSTDILCSKQQFDDISFVCSDENDLINQWNHFDQICQTVSCGDYAVFGIGDIDADDDDDLGCINSEHIMTEINNITNIECSAAADDICDVYGSCKWSIPSPQCKINYNQFTIPTDNNHFYYDSTFYVIIIGSMLTIICSAFIMGKCYRKRRQYILEYYSDDSQTSQ